MLAGATTTADYAQLWHQCSIFNPVQHLDELGKLTVRSAFAKLAAVVYYEGGTNNGRQTRMGSSSGCARGTGGPGRRQSRFRRNNQACLRNECEDIGLGSTNIGIRYEIPNVAPVITEAQAIQAAKDIKPGLADQAASIETRY